MSDKHRLAASARGAKRTADVSTKVAEAMTTIEKEMKANDGIYPGNGGAVSKNEVARRAGINLTTLFSPRQRALNENVTAWLRELSKREPVSRERVRRTYAERAEDWKARYLALQASHVKTELDLQSAQSERDEAQLAAERYKKESLALSEQLAKRPSNVRAIRPK